MDAMKPGAAKRQKRFLLLWIVALVMIVFAVVAFSWPAPATYSVTFRVVDAATGEPLGNAWAYTLSHWTPLPLERLGIERLNPWKATRLLGGNGIFDVPGVPQRSSPSLEAIIFYCSGYHSVAFNPWDDAYLLSRADRAAELLPHTNDITVALEADGSAKGPPPVFIR